MLPDGIVLINYFLVVVRLINQFEFSINYKTKSLFFVAFIFFFLVVKDVRDFFVSFIQRKNSDID